MRSKAILNCATFTRKNEKKKISAEIQQLTLTSSCQRRPLTKTHLYRTSQTGLLRLLLI